MEIGLNNIYCPISENVYQKDDLQRRPKSDNQKSQKKKIRKKCYFTRGSDSFEKEHQGATKHNYLTAIKQGISI